MNIKKNTAQHLGAIYSSLNMYKSSDPKMHYCSGDVYLYPWSKQKFLKLKLFSSDSDVDKLMDYVMELLSYNLFLHNYFRRFWAQYNHGVKIGHVCECWDCTAEVYILDTYLNNSLNFSTLINNVTRKLGKIGGAKFVENKLNIKNKDDVGKLMRYISQSLGPKSYLAFPPHGIYTNLKPINKLQSLIFNFSEFL
jgi:hypothetical protein